MQCLIYDFSTTPGRNIKGEHLVKPAAQTLAILYAAGTNCMIVQRYIVAK